MFANFFGLMLEHDADVSSDDDFMHCEQSDFWSIMDDSAEEPCDPATSTRTSCPIGLRTDSIPTNPEFESSYRNQRPFILAAALTDWPAVHLWSSDQHLRTLPASSAVRCLYAHDNTNFLKNILTTAEDLDMAHAVNDVLEQPTGRRAYLRTNLANFEGSLQQEVDVGAIAEMVNGSDTQIQPSGAIAAPFKAQNCGLWISSPGCVTPLHFDLCHGFLCQLRGTKRVVMFAPTDLRSLYPNSQHSTNPNTSQINYGKWVEGDPEQRALFPNVKNADPFEAILQPGDVLYIPPFWWHWVETMDLVSCSVLLPFDPDMARGEGVHPCIDESKS